MKRRVVITGIALLAASFGGSAFGGSAASQAPTGEVSLAAALSELEQTETARARVDTEVEGLVAEQQAARERLRGRVRTLYRLRRAGVLPLAGGFDALLRHQSRVTRLERMVAHDLEGIGTLRRRSAALSQESAELAEAIDALRGRAEALREREEARESQLAALASLMGDAPALGVDPAGAWSGPSTASGFGIRLSDGSPIGGLAPLRGRLPLPVSGTARLSESTREGGAGLELAATPGVVVRAVADGRVAYAAPHPAYRRLVIVDHGDTHFTVYGGLATIAVSAGQAVTTNAALGAVGAEPVFFQVRRGSRPLPAREWLGI